MAKSGYGDMLEAIYSDRSGDDQPQTRKLKPVKLSVELEIDGNAIANWQDFLFEYDDLFDWVHIGGWAECIGRHKSRGVLIAESEMLDSEDDGKTEKRAALRAWRAGKPLPIGFYAIDKKVVLRSFIEGVKELGLNWQDHNECDGPFMGRLVQIGLFGEPRYD
jgi:hypothetical protein